MGEEFIHSKLRAVAPLYVILQEKPKWIVAGRAVCTENIIFSDFVHRPLF
jgi:hypothetical protein